ncbi:MAG: hypothetical protein ACOX0A_09290 [Thermoguttaceae bacterium]
MAVITLSGDATLTYDRFADVETTEGAADNTVVEFTEDPADQTNRIIDPNVRVSVVSDHEDEAQDDEFDMGAAGDLLLSEENAATQQEVVEPYFDDDLFDDALFIDFANDVNEDDSQDDAWMTEPISSFNFATVAATREANEPEDDWLVFDSNEFEDEDVFIDEDTFFVDDVEAADEDESSFEIVFDSNDFDAEDSLIDEEELFINDFVADDVDEIDDDWLVFDSNDFDDEDPLIDDEELFVDVFDADDAVETDDDWLVFDSNDFDDEDSLIDDEELLVDIFETDDADETDDDWLVFDSNDFDDEDSLIDDEELLVDIFETDDADETDDDWLVFDSNDFDDEDSFIDEDTFFVDETNEKDVEEKTSSTAEIIFDSNEVVDLYGSADESTGYSSEIVFDSNEIVGSDVDSADEKFDALPDIDFLEIQEGFFKGLEPVEENEKAPSDNPDAEDDAKDALETVKVVGDVILVEEILDDADTDSSETEVEVQLEEPDAPATYQEADPGKEPRCSPPVGRVIILSVDSQDQPSALVESEEVENRYYSAATAERVSAQIADEDVEDEMWIVSQAGGGMNFWQLENHAWNQKESQSFFSSDDPNRVTIICVHGYQTDMTAATQDGFVLKSILDRARQATGVDRKYRIVIWKWDSERYYARLRIDAMEKQDIAYFRGVDLGNFVGRLHPDDDVAFIGFSFGAIVAGSALQTLATTANPYMTGHKRPGIAMSGAQFDQLEEQEKGRISLLLLSAACDYDSFGKYGTFRDGANLPTRVLNVYNPVDFALKFYPAISSSPLAVGVAPLRGHEFPNAVGSIYNLNASGVLGKTHSFQDAVSAIPSETLVNLLF